VGADRVDIHPADKHGVPGVYTIGVFAYTAITRFELTVRLCAPARIATLPVNAAHSSAQHGGLTRRQNAPHFFRVPVDPYKRGTLYVKAHGSLPSSLAPVPLVLYASNTLMYPDCALHRWKSRPTTTSSSSSSLSSSCGFNVDTDEFKYSKRFCSFAVQIDDDSKANADSKKEEEEEEEDVQYTIDVRLVLEDDQLPERLRGNFRCFQRLFDKIDGGTVSQRERKRCGVAKNKSFTYGEIVFVSVAHLLEVVKPQRGEIFYDLGSGTGRAVFAAYYIAPEFRACRGIELLQGLHDQAVKRLAAFDADATLRRAHKNDDDDDDDEKKRIVHFECADMLKTAWFADANVIYVSSICFEASLFTALYAQLKRVQRGTRIISLKTFPSGWEQFFRIIYQGWEKHSWGRCNVSVFVRK
jgi:SAM-dependent methyltransferase